MLMTGALIPVTSTSLGPSTASAQPSVALEGYFIGEFLGEYQLRSNGDRVGGENDIDLDPTLGGGVRASLNLGVVAIGGMAEFRGYGNDEYEDRDFAFDLSPFLGLRIPLVEGDTSLILRATVPFGFTILAPDESTFGSDRYYGFNTGGLAGLEVLFGRVGIFAEGGVRYHRVYSQADFGPLGTSSVSLSWVQVSVNAGLSFHL